MVSTFNEILKISHVLREHATTWETA